MNRGEIQFWRTAVENPVYTPKLVHFSADGFSTFPLLWLDCIEPHLQVGSVIPLCILFSICLLTPCGLCVAAKMCDSLARV